MDFSKAVKNEMNPLAEDISRLCRINSAEGDAKPGMPFGEGPAKALEAILAIGEAMGFRTVNYDNYVGEIEYGEGDEMLGILGHVDVVPAGEGWSRDPWGGEISDGVIWGRGTLDDKGPMLTCLHALKIIKDMELPLNKRVRLIIGCNEETDWKCMDYYLNEVKPELPTIAFSPDSHFPVTYAEMGMLQFRLERPVSENIEIKGGNAFNSVPSKAQVILPAAMENDVKTAISESINEYDFEMPEKEWVAAFTDGARDLLGVVLVLAASRGISGFMGTREEGMSITFVYWIQNILSGVPLWAFVIAAIAVYCLIALVLQSTSGVAGITMPIFGALAMGLFATASCGSVGGQVVLMSSFTVGINFVCGMYPESTNMGICEMVNMPYPVYLKTILKFTLPLLIVAAVIISVAPYVGLA